MLNSTTTRISAMKMPFLPRSARMWPNLLVNLFSTGFTWLPAATPSAGLVSRLDMSLCSYIHQRER
jgi:hypothetical protein